MWQQSGFENWDSRWFADKLAEAVAATQVYCHMGSSVRITNELSRNQLDGWPSTGWRTSPIHAFVQMRMGTMWLGKSSL